MKNQSLSWDVKKQSDKTLIIFTGDVDETCDFTGLKGLTGEVVFDLASVRRLNSEGVRRWVSFIRGLDGVDTLIFTKCSIPLVNQFNMVRGMHEGAEIRSFYAPYISDASGHEQRMLLTMEDLKDPRHPPTLPTDHGEMRLDEIPERYFAFLTEE